MISIMLVKLLSKFVPDLDKKLESEYRLVKENKYDEILMEMETVYYIQRKDSLTSWSTITKEFPNEQIALEYYSKIKEYLNNKKLSITYLN